MIFTIGYERLKPQFLTDLCDAIDGPVIDVRSRPVSRRAGFGGNQLAALLGELYIWRGKDLGGIPPGKITATGLAWLQVQSGNVILLCQEEAPGECHRHKIALRVKQPVIHIYQDELIDALELERAIRDDDDYDVVDFDKLKSLLNSRPS